MITAVTVTIVLLITNVQRTTASQLPDFPADFCCNLTRPLDRILGPVRTVLTVERNVRETFSTDAMTYDSKGSKLEWLHHSSGTAPEAPVDKLIRLDFKHIYTYNPRGKLIQVTLYDEQNSMYGKKEFTYDRKGRLSEEIHYIRGRLHTKRLYTYQPRQQRITVITTDSSDESRQPRILKSILSFKAHEHSIKETFYSGDTIERSGIFFFDGKGTLIKWARYAANSSFEAAYLYTHKFDRYGNWIEREERYTNQENGSDQSVGVSQMITFRVITYR